MYRVYVRGSWMAVDSGWLVEAFARSEVGFPSLTAQVQPHRLLP